MPTLGIDTVPFEISEDCGGELKIPFIRTLEMDGSFEDLFNYKSNSEFTQGLKVWYIFLIFKGLEYLYLNGVKAYGCLTPRKILYRKPSEGFSLAPGVVRLSLSYDNGIHAGASSLVKYSSKIGWKRKW